MPTGPSATLVMHLHDPPPTAEGRPNPPLQRTSKHFYKVSLPSSAEECLESHVKQITERQATSMNAHKEAKARHVAEMHELRDRVGASFEEQAARRAWHRTIAHEQLAQTGEKLTAALLDYKEAHTGIEYWPYEADPPAVVKVDPKTYGAELLAAADDKKRQVALQTALRRGGPTSLRLRKEREREMQAHDAAERLAPAEVKLALAAAAAKKREAVSEQAAQRVAAAAAAEGRGASGGGSRGASAGASGEGFLTGADVIEQMGRMQLKEAQRELRQHQNKLQLREVLARQAAEKRLRELREHQSTYGDLPDATATLAKLTNRASTNVTDAEQRALAGAQRRSELEAAIAKKQRERHELRRKTREEQRKLDDAAATEEVLMYERDRYAKLEQQTGMMLALTKQEAEAKKRSSSRGAA
jgi:hypothetical protein